MGGSEVVVAAVLRVALVVEQEAVLRVEVAVVVPPEDLPDAHQVVRQAGPDPEVPLHLADHVVQVYLMVLGPEVPFRPVMGSPGHRQLSRSLGLSDQMGYPLNPIILVRVRVLVFWEGFVGVGSLDPLLVDIAGGVVAMTDQPLVEAILSTHWSLL